MANPLYDIDGLIDWTLNGKGWDNLPISDRIMVLMALLWEKQYGYSHYLPSHEPHEIMEDLGNPASHAGHRWEHLLQIYRIQSAEQGQTYLEAKRRIEAVIGDLSQFTHDISEALFNSPRPDDPDDPGDTGATGDTNIATDGGIANSGKMGPRQTDGGTQWNVPAIRTVTQTATHVTTIQHGGINFGDNAQISNTALVAGDVYGKWGTLNWRKLTRSIIAQFATTEDVIAFAKTYMNLDLKRWVIVAEGLNPDTLTTSEYVEVMINNVRLSENSKLLDTLLDGLRKQFNVEIDI